MTDHDTFLIIFWLGGNIEMTLKRAHSKIFVNFTNMFNENSLS